MDELELIELLVGQRESALELWKSLLTVSLAIIAFFGAMKNTVESYINWILLSLYCLFAASNFRALWRNLSVREDIGSLLQEVNSGSPFLSSLVPSSSDQYLSLGFHLIVDMCVVILFVGMYAFSRNSSLESRNSDASN